VKNENKNENKNAWSKEISTFKIIDAVVTLALMGLLALVVFEIEGLESKIEKNENIKIKKNNYTCDLIK